MANKVKCDQCDGKGWVEYPRGVVKGATYLDSQCQHGRKVVQVTGMTGDGRVRVRVVASPMPEDMIGDNEFVVDRMSPARWKPYRLEGK